MYQTGTEGDILIKTDGTRCSLFLGNQPEQPCYPGVVIVPEFPVVFLVLGISVMGIVLISMKNRLQIRI